MRTTRMAHMHNCIPVGPYHWFVGALLASLRSVDRLIGCLPGLNAWRTWHIISTSRVWSLVLCVPYIVLPETRPLHARVAINPHIRSIYTLTG